MLQRLVYFIKFGVVSAAVWCILSDELSGGAVMTGFLLGMASSGISDLLLTAPGFSPAGKFLLKPHEIFKYLFVLLKNIYKSGILAIRKIITEDIDVGIVVIDTELRNPLNRTILANSITMTPGTVTVEMEENRLTVLLLEKTNTDRKKTGEIIKGALETILKRSEQRG